MVRQSLDSFFDRAVRWFPGDRDLRWSLRQVRYGYRHRAIGLAVVQVGDLRVQKEPTVIPADWSRPEDRFKRPARVVTNPVDRFFPRVRGVEDRRLKYLPHCAALESYVRTGRLPVDSDYARLLRARALLQGRQLPEASVSARMQRLVSTYCSIRDQGYLGSGYRRKRIVVLQRPIHPATSTYRPTGYEVFDGHHRAVALTFLGADRVEVLVTEAVRVADFSWEAEPFDESIWEKAGPGSTER